MLPDSQKAQFVADKLHQLGIKDVLPFYDHQVKLWAMCQVEHKPRTILSLGNVTPRDSVRPIIMYWIRTPKGAYRAPNEQDISDVVAIVKRAQVIFDKSKDNPDWLDDQLLEQERVKTEKHKKRQDENLRYGIRHFGIQEELRKSLK